MFAQVEKSKENGFLNDKAKSRAIANSVAQKKRDGKQGFGFADNRPEAEKTTQLLALMNNRNAQQHQTIQEKGNNTGLPDNLEAGFENPSTVQMRRVITGHGNVRRNPIANQIINTTIPNNVTVIRAAPIGATLGNSMAQHIDNNPNRTADEYRAEAIINTTSTPGEIWNNGTLRPEIAGAAGITKTSSQNSIFLHWAGYANLSAGHKTSLGHLEGKKDFEVWLHNRVINNCFVTINGGANIPDIDLTSVTNAERVLHPGPEVTYADDGDTMSGIIASNNDTYVINSCSYDGNSEYTGIQVDKS